MDTNLLYEILGETTEQFRKGPEITKSQHGPLEVVDVYLMPQVPNQTTDTVQVDMHFLVVSVNITKATQRKADLIKILNNWPNGELAGGPSYISVGGTIGDQGAAFCLFALGKVLGLWNITTPESFGMTGEEANRAASSGFIMITGYKTQKEAP